MTLDSRAFIGGSVGRRAEYAVHEDTESVSQAYWCFSVCAPDGRRALLASLCRLFFLAMCAPSQSHYVCVCVFVCVLFLHYVHMRLFRFVSPLPSLLTVVFYYSFHRLHIHGPARLLQFSQSPVPACAFFFG